MTLSNTSIVELSSIRSIQGWEEFLTDGEKYMKTAVGAHAKHRKAFTPEILYNIIAMAIEKFVMAALMHHGALPYNHTMTDLVEAMEETFPSALADIKDDLLALDKYQEICSLDAFYINPPEMKEIPGMLNLMAKLQLLITEKLIQEPDRHQVH